MNRLQCIQVMRDTPALSALSAAVAKSRSDLECWAAGMAPEELAFAKRMQATLIELEVECDREAVRMGETMNRRLIAERQAETHYMHKEAA